MRNLATSETESSADAGEASGEKLLPTDGEPAESSTPDSTEVPSRPETVGSKKVD